MNTVSSFPALLICNVLFNFSMFRLCVLLCVVFAVNAGSLANYNKPQHRSDGDHYQTYNYDYAYAQDNFVDRVKTSVTGFLDPLLTIDFAILGVIVAGFLIVFNYLGIISLGSILPSIQSALDGREKSRMYKSARQLIGDDIDILAEVVQKAVHNAKAWEKLW